MKKETQLIEVGKCITNKYQPRSRNTRDVEGLARNMRVNGQLTPITVVGDGETYQVVYGHRRLAAAKMNGNRWIEAYVEESWEDAVMARRLFAENCNREDPTAGETGEAIQTMLALGVPVTQVAASADMDVTKVRDFARGAMRVPDADGAASFDALVKIGEYRDVLDDADIEKIMSVKYDWEMASVCRKAQVRADRAKLAAKLERQGVRVIESCEIDSHTMRPHDGEGDRAGLVAFITCGYDSATPHFYRVLTDEELETEAARREAGETEPEPEPERCEPTPAEIEAEQRYRARFAALDDLDAHVTSFAKSAFGKFPSGNGHSKLRKWAHEAYEKRYGEPDAAWNGVKRPRGGMVDRFVLMHAVPGCLPHVGRWMLHDGYEPDGNDVMRIEEFLHFHCEVMAFARYRPTDEEAELFAHLRSLIAGESEQPEPEAEPACPIVELAESIVAEAAAEAEPVPMAA